MHSKGHVDPFIAREDNTANDEAIARAMAESMSSETTTFQQQQTRSPTAKCPGGHGLELFQTSHVQKVKCNVCNRDLERGSRCWSCLRCNYDACESCYQKGNTVFMSTQTQQPQTSNFASPSPLSNNPFTASSSHMATVLGTIGNIAIEMLIDTGAQTSVLSMPIVRQLGLMNRLDRRYMGVAAGVGQARICGKISNVICAFGVGHVEFPMDFIVLDISDSLVILGLDQMRKYKCLVDMEREKLVFGGSNGIEVDMLPPTQQHVDFRGLSSGCVVM
mmetsp:Transcript_28272/g.40402  ORF Transcript_28272/g.40402 Transcript_28272/m.40402 type:complete len:276 (+) Transcript_28272:188-1015(+)